MPKPGPRNATRCSAEFESGAVRLSQLAGAQVKDIAEVLYIHAFVLSRWRKEAREGPVGK